MHRSEVDALANCAVCGASVDTQGAQAYPIGSQSVLCFECALARGGSFDAAQDRWVEAPRIADLVRDEG
jgi:hypothetical protein